MKRKARKKEERPDADEPVFVSGGRHAHLRDAHLRVRVFESPARRRAVMVADDLWRMKIKNVIAPRLVFVTAGGYGAVVYEAEDDGKPLSKSTRVLSVCGKIGNVIGADAICYGNALEHARDRPVSTFWNTRFDYFQSRRKPRDFAQARTLVDTVRPTVRDALDGWGEKK